MNKINFENLPSTNTPVNASNLNQLQTNVDEGKIDKTLTNFEGNLDTIKTTGFIYASGTATNIPLSGYSFYISTMALNNNHVNQVAYRVAGTLNNMETYQRECTNGTWTAWRKTSPINLTTGTEFETGKVIDGKKEYGKRIDFGYLPNASSKVVAHGLRNVTYTGIKGVTTNGLPLPLGHPAATSYNILLQVNSSNVQVVTGTDRSSYYAYVTLYYTKN